jgi:hypothetical protein
MRPRLRPPSPSLVVAIIALVVACAGTATAASVLIRSSGQVAPGTINTTDLRDGRGVSLEDLTRRARFRLGAEPGEPGAEGPRGSQGPAGPRGLTGPPGANGADGSAIAFAYVNADGSLDDAKSKGVSSVAKSSNPRFPDGVYCFDLVPSPSNAVASIDFATTATSLEDIYLLLPGTASGLSSTLIAGLCPAAQQDAAALTTDGTASPLLVPRGFWISFN